MRLRPAAARALLLGGALVEARGLITSSAGQRGAIPRWRLQSSSLLDADLAGVSRPGRDTSAWHAVEASRCTVMGCLVAAGVYNDTELWYSDNLAKVDSRQFSVPWVYRGEFGLAVADGQHYMLETNGITASADVFLNGARVADSRVQAGSFGGHGYDITGLVRSDNALVVQARPADFNHDLVQGFVDWNPAAPDNGSGIWRDVYVKQTGPVSMGPVSVAVAAVPGSPAVATVRAVARNLEHRVLRLRVESTITRCSSSSDDDDDDDQDDFSSRQDHIWTLGPRQSSVVEVAHTIHEPSIWWPRQWGRQPLYETHMTFSVDDAVSDTARRSFGIRTVTSHVNSHNDTIFAINGHPFQVLGAGYAADHFFRWDRQRFLSMARYTLDMGLNTIRLEGMLEHPELYEIADELGLMVMPGWVCCSKWEAWRHNHDLQTRPVPYWDAHDYRTAAASIRHEAAMLQPHPSVMAFLVGSDSWPDDAATRIYVDALGAAHWQTPIVASAAKRGYPALLGPSGMKMDGPYDWVPPNYWFDTEPSEHRLGAAFGFASELGAGVGTPELGSLRRFLSPGDLDDLWTRPDKDLFHMSSSTSSFRNRGIYNRGLYGRFGPPTSLDDYLLKAQMMDYEATRAQHEAYASRWSARRPATGTIYWMLNNAWPALHWNLFDKYMHPAGSYFGAKVGCRVEHVAYDYVDHTVWLINRSLVPRRNRTVSVELVDVDGRVLFQSSRRAAISANTAVPVSTVERVSSISGVGFLRLVLSDETGVALSRNVYWLSKAVDTLNWKNSTWYHTPVSEYADLSALGDMKPATVVLRPRCPGLNSGSGSSNGSTQRSHHLELENTSQTPAFFIRLNLVDDQGDDVNPVQWSDNYVTLWPCEKLQLDVAFSETGARRARVIMSGGNVGFSQVLLGECRDA